MRFIYEKLFVSLCLLILSMATHATVLTPESRQVNLLHDVQFLEDASGTLSLDDVRNMDERFRSWTRGGTEINFGFTASAYWIRLPLQRMETAPKDWLLELNYAKLNELDFYSSNKPAIHTGSSRDFSSRPYFDRFFVFPLEPTTKSEYVYLRVTSRYALTVPMTIWQPDAYLQRQQRFQALQFMYYGGLVVLALYGLIIFLALRDTRFLVYCAYIVTVGLGIFAGNGFGRQMFWPNAVAFDEVSQSLFLSLGAFFVVQFARKILLLPKDRTALNLSMQLSQWLFLLICIFTLLQVAFPFSLQLVNQALMVNSVAMGILIGCGCIRAYRQKRQGIRFFLIAWIVLWLGISIASLRALSFLPSNGFTSYAVQLSTVIDMVLMALALADLLRIEHEAYNESQRRTLAAKNSLLELTQASEENLRRAVRDRTEQLETSLKLEKMLLEQYVRFGSMISHEFRTPLSIIQIQASTMRKEHERGVDKVMKRLGAIGSAAQRLTVMFDKWLHSDAITHTLEVLELKPIELETWLRTLISSIPHLLLNHSVELHFQPQAAIVYADEYHLGIALTNLIDNAAKYSPENTAIVIEIFRKEEHVCIAVTDEGPGIPLELQEKVFGEFFRLSPESLVRGVGLGLSIVQRIALAHGGHVELSSMPGAGATFCIWLPIKQFKEIK